MSPTVFRSGPYRFYFFSREEPRMHVHVQSSDGEAKFWLEPSIELAQNFGLNSRDIKQLEGLVQEHEHEIRDAWRATSVLEVTNISRHGFWLLLNEQELFLSFEDFPWFRDATIAQIINVELPAPHHLYWPDLDVDLAVESLAHPERYPLVSSKSTSIPSS